VAVGARLSSVTTPNAHRVLKLRGIISPDFRWPDPARTDDPRIILESEGILFDGYGGAALDQRMPAKELAEAIGLETAPDE
jgi:hypothetical protein